MQSKKEASRQREEVKVCLRQCTTCRYPGKQAVAACASCLSACRVSQVWHALMSASAFNCCYAISFSSVRCQLSAICCLLPRQSISLHCPSVCPLARLTVRALSVRQSINPLVYISAGNFMVASIVGLLAPLACPCGISGFAQLMQLLLRLNRTYTDFLFPSPYSLTCPFFSSSRTDTSRAINSQLTNRLSTQRGGKFDSFVHAQ